MRTHPGVRHLCWLHYMTPEQFRARREQVLDYLGYSPEISDGDVLADLDRQQARRRAEATIDDAWKGEDRRYLARLLRSYDRFGAEYLRSPGLIELGDFALRAEYTNDLQGDEPKPFLLLSEVEIAYDGGAIDDRIELLDLPGFGSRMASHDLLTGSFLNGLDGALIFQSSEQVAAKEVYDLLTRLSPLYPRLTGRVWMIFTRLDALPRDSLGYGATTTTILDNIQETMTDNRVPLTQVVLVGNEFHRRLLTPDGTIRSPTGEEYRFILNIDVDASGRPVLPPGFDRHAELKDAYEAVLADGGIERVRQIIGRTLADEVEREVRDDVAARLGWLQRDLKRQIQAARDASNMDGQSFKKIIMWKVQLQTIQQLLDRERELVEKPFLDLIGHLRTQFATPLPPNLKIEPKGLPAQHAAYIRVLSDTALSHSQSATLPKLYDAVGDLVAEAEAKVGKLRFGRFDSPMQAWRDVAPAGPCRPELVSYRPPGVRLAGAVRPRRGTAIARRSISRDHGPEDRGGRPAALIHRAPEDPQASGRPRGRSGPHRLGQRRRR